MRRISPAEEEIIRPFIALRWPFLREKKKEREREREKEKEIPTRGPTFLNSFHFHCSNAFFIFEPIKGKNDFSRFYLNFLNFTRRKPKRKNSIQSRKKNSIIIPRKTRRSSLLLPLLLLLLLLLEEERTETLRAINLFPPPLREEKLDGVLDTT